ncbi:MAG TPA: histidine phosphatase family protein [Pseudolabrys sp.]|nr:histidine phosphatase family protein [Pseudolabrys sp.]
MRGLRLIVSLVVALTLLPFSASAADVAGMIAMLRQGGYVLVIRHGATDNGQKDVYPFVFDDMKKQRQLSEQGRQAARQMGDAIKTLNIPLGEIYTSKLNRAIETGSLISGGRTIQVAALTDSGAGSASAMSEPGGSNAKIGKAIRDLVNKAPVAGTNNVLVTHKTNIADAFGKSVSDVKEGETLIYKPGASGAPALVGRMQSGDWTAQAANPKH